MSSCDTRSELLVQLKQISELNETKQWRIGEAARLLGMTTENLRVWQADFEGLSPRKLESGHRLYSKELLLRYWITKYLLHEQCFSKKGAADHLEKIFELELTPKEVVASFEGLFSKETSTTSDLSEEEATAYQNEQLLFKIEQLEKSVITLRNALTSRELESSKLEDEQETLKKQLEDSSVKIEYLEKHLSVYSVENMRLKAEVSALEEELSRSLSQAESLQRRIDSRDVTYVETTVALNALLSVREQLSSLLEETSASLN